MSHDPSVEDPAGAVDPGDDGDAGASGERRVRTAVILAAGTGSRLRSVVGRWPKTMVEVGKESLFARSLRCLRRAGVERLVLVVGYRWGVLKSAVADLWPGAELLQNDAYDETGSMRSLSVAAGCCDGALVLESDILYECRALDEVLSAEGDDVVLVSGPTEAGDEVWVCGPDDGRVREISKEPSDEWPRQGELVGISRLSAATLARMAESHRAAGQAAAQEHYEERIAAVAPERDVRWHRVDDLIWTETDTPEQLNRAERFVLPAIQRREEGQEGDGG